MHIYKNMSRYYILITIRRILDGTREIGRGVTCYPPTQNVNVKQTDWNHSMLADNKRPSSTFSHTHTTMVKLFSENEAISIPIYFSSLKIWCLLKPLLVIRP